MNGLFVDSNVILDLFLDDPQWGDWAEATLTRLSDEYVFYINSIIYTEVSLAFQRIEELEAALSEGGFQLTTFPREALFLAGKAFRRYRKNKGPRTTPLPDFFIGAQATVLGVPLVTREINRYRTCFPTLALIHPES